MESLNTHVKRKRKKPNKKKREERPSLSYNIATNKNDEDNDILPHVVKNVNKRKACSLSAQKLNNETIKKTKNPGFMASFQKK